MEQVHLTRITTIQLLGTSSGEALKVKRKNLLQLVNSFSLVSEQTILVGRLELNLESSMVSIELPVITDVLTMENVILSSIS